MDRMNVDHVLDTMNRHTVEYLLIGGMNFLLRHEPVLTFDIDFWVHDTPHNLDRCEAAMADLDAAWGPTEDSWRPVRLQPGWTRRQAVFCLTTPHGSVDVFRSVAGLGGWNECLGRSYSAFTAGGISFKGLGDSDMIACQMALAPEIRKHARVDALLRAMEAARHGGLP